MDNLKLTINPRRKSGIVSLVLALMVTSGMLFTAGCSGGGSGKSKVDGAVRINGTLTNCFGDSVFLYELVGSDARKIASALVTKEKQAGTFTLDAKVPHTGFYQIGSGPRANAMVILGEEDEVNFTGDCFDMPKTARVDGSPINEGYLFLTQKVNRKNNEANQIIQNIRTFSVTNPQLVPQLQNDMVRVQEEKSELLDSIMAEGGYLAKIASLLHFKPYGYDPSSQKYGNERNYFLNTFFEGIDVADGDMAYIPQYSERFRQYVLNLAQQQQPNDTIKVHIDEVLGKIPATSQNYSVALTGILMGLDQAKSDLYLTYGEDYLNKYPERTGFTIGLQNRIDEIKRFAVGSIPPDISLPDQNGNMLSLSSLRGQYVMIDFWASWCRPCRAENPNVVRLYNQYHPKGFEVLGVSLDKDKMAWLAAIKQDRLTWKHVSDLKFWQSQAAQDYQVNSIPMTFLLDKEGRIIGKNLRGKALENKLGELFNS